MFGSASVEAATEADTARTSSVFHAGVDCHWSGATLTGRMGSSGG